MEKVFDRSIVIVLKSYIPSIILAVMFVMLRSPAQRAVNGNSARHHEMSLPQYKLDKCCQLSPELRPHPPMHEENMSAL